MCARTPARLRGNIGPHCGRGNTFDWSVGLSTGVFLLIREDVRLPSSQWIPTMLTSSPTSSYSTSTSVSIPLQLYLGSPSTALIFFQTCIFAKSQVFSLASRPYAVSLLPHGAPLRSPSLFYIKSFFGLFSNMLHPDGFRNHYQYHQIETPPPSD